MATIFNIFWIQFSAFELPRELKMVATPMFVMLRIAIKALGKLLVVVLLAAFLNFKMAAI